MKGFLLSATAIIALALPAAAADLPGKAQKYEPPQVPACNWCGFYLFASGGYGWGSISPDIDIAPFSSPDPKGWVFGGGAGYNWVYGQLLGGLEVEYSIADLKEDQSVDATKIDPRLPAKATVGLHTKFDSIGSVRARTGFIVGNSLLLYGSGGLAFAKSKVSVTSTDLCRNCDALASATETHFGWVLGGGAEYMIARNLTVGVDWSHYDFGKTQHNFTVDALTVPLVLGVKADSVVDVVRGRVSLKF